MGLKLDAFANSWELGDDSRRDHDVHGLPVVSLKRDGAETSLFGLDRFDCARERYVLLECLLGRLSP